MLDASQEVPEVSVVGGRVGLDVVLVAMYENFYPSSLTKRPNEIVHLPHASLTYTQVKYLRVVRLRPTSEELLVLLRHIRPGLKEKNALVNFSSSSATNQMSFSALTPGWRRWKACGNESAVLIQPSAPNSASEPLPEDKSAQKSTLVRAHLVYL
jgi:hypothetical protein